MIFGVALNAVLVFVVGLTTVSDFLAELGHHFLGVVVAIQVTHVCRHGISLCVVWTSSLFSFPPGLSPRPSEVLSVHILQMLVNSYLSGRCQSMSETQCQRANVNNSMSETQCLRLNVRVSMSESQCQRHNIRDPISEIQCQGLNVRDSMSETQCQKPNVRNPISATPSQSRIY